MRYIFTAISAGLLACVATAQPGGELTVASLNLDKKTMTPERIAEIKDTPALRDADVLLLQEVINSPSTRVANDLGAALHRNVTFAKAYEWQPGIDEGIAILSRYPVKTWKVLPLERYYLHFHNRVRIALLARIQTPRGEAEIIDVHLDNRINEREKLTQLQPLWNAIAQWHGPAVIGGDFNTTDFYWVSHVIPLPRAQRTTEAVREAMSAHGFITPFGNTPATHHLGFQLDWIFVRQIKPLDARVLPIAFSDHNAVWTKLLLERS